MLCQEIQNIMSLAIALKIKDLSSPNTMIWMAVQPAVAWNISSTHLLLFLIQHILFPAFQIANISYHTCFIYFFFLCTQLHSFKILQNSSDVLWAHSITTESPEASFLSTYLTVPGTSFPEGLDYISQLDTDCLICNFSKTKIIRGSGKTGTRFQGGLPISVCLGFFGLRFFNVKVDYVVDTANFLYLLNILTSFLQTIFSGVRLSRVFKRKNWKQRIHLLSIKTLFLLLWNKSGGMCAVRHMFIQRELERVEFFESNPHYSPKPVWVQEAFGQCFQTQSVTLDSWPLCRVRSWTLWTWYVLSNSEILWFYDLPFFFYFVFLFYFVN